MLQVMISEAVHESIHFAYGFEGAQLFTFC